MNEMNGHTIRFERRWPAPQEWKGMCPLCLLPAVHFTGDCRNGVCFNCDMIMPAEWMEAA